MAHFLPSRYNFCELYACRGTSLIEVANLSPVTKLGEGSGAVSRRAPQKRSESGGTSYLGARNLSRSRILFVGRCACPGATAITNLSWVQEQKLRSVATKSRCGGTKSVTNNLPLLSVLWLVLYFLNPLFN
jgi:hypothetical protein